MTHDPDSTRVMHDVTRPASRQEQAHDLPVSLPCNEQGHTTMSNDTFTIIQRTALDSWSIVDVVQGDIELACELAAMACNAAGVARTLVLDSLGSCVCIES